MTPKQAALLFLAAAVLGSGAAILTDLGIFPVLAAVWLGMACVPAALLVIGILGVMFG